MKQKKPIFNAVADTKVCECGRVLVTNETCIWCEIKKELVRGKYLQTKDVKVGVSRHGVDA